MCIDDDIKKKLHKSTILTVVHAHCSIKSSWNRRYSAVPKKSRWTVVLKFDRSERCSRCFILFFFCIFFWRARVCRPLLRLCRPFMIFEGCLDSNPECCRSKLARYRLSHPSPFMFYNRCFILDVLLSMF
jgi:hypothetical protein